MDSNPSRVKPIRCYQMFEMIYTGCSTKRRLVLTVLDAVTRVRIHARN